MKPDIRNYRGDDPDYLRGLIARAGLSQRAAAIACGIPAGDFRRYLNGRRKAPYSVQYLLEQLAAPEDYDEPDDACTNPDGHKWNRTAGEADEARLAGDHENDNIRCIYCDADGDA